MGTARSGGCKEWGLQGVGTVRSGDCKEWGLQGVGTARSGDCKEWGLQGVGTARSGDCKEWGLQEVGTARSSRDKQSVVKDSRWLLLHGKNNHSCVPHTPWTHPLDTPAAESATVAQIM